MIVHLYKSLVQTMEFQRGQWLTNSSPDPHHRWRHRLSILTQLSNISIYRSRDVRKHHTSIHHEEFIHGQAGSLAVDRYGRDCKSHWLAGWMDYLPFIMWTACEGCTCLQARVYASGVTHARVHADGKVLTLPGLTLTAPHVPFIPRSVITWLTSAVGA